MNNRIEQGQSFLPKLARATSISSQEKAVPVIEISLSKAKTVGELANMLRPHIDVDNLRVSGTDYTDPRKIDVLVKLGGDIVIRDFPNSAYGEKFVAQAKLAILAALVSESVDKFNELENTEIGRNWEALQAVNQVRIPNGRSNIRLSEILSMDDEQMGATIRKADLPLIKKVNWGQYAVTSALALGLLPGCGSVANALALDTVTSPVKASPTPTEKPAPTPSRTAEPTPTPKISIPTPTSFVKPTEKRPSPTPTEVSLQEKQAKEIMGSKIVADFLAGRGEYADSQWKYTAFKAGAGDDTKPGFLSMPRYDYINVQGILMGKFDIEGRQFLILGTIDSAGARVITPVKLFTQKIVDFESVDVLMLGSTNFLDQSGMSLLMANEQQVEEFIRTNVGKAIVVYLTNYPDFTDLSTRDKFVCSLWRPDYKQTWSQAEREFARNCSVPKADDIFRINSQADLFKLVKFEKSIPVTNAVAGHKY